MLLTVVSCKDEFLEVPPFGPVSEATLSNEGGVNKLLVGAYSLIKWSGASGGGAQTGDAYIFGSDENRMGTTTGVSPDDVFAWTPVTSRVASKWQFCYAGVGRANDVLRIIPNVKDSSPEKLLQIEAEARFIRAYFYFKLASSFRNVPWIDETITYDQGNYLVPNTLPIWPHIEDDFKFAADNLTETKPEVGRANKWAAKAFLAKTYIFQLKYAEAKPILEDIIANGQTSNGLKYKLLDRYNDNFIRRTANGSEAVFVMQNSVKDGEPNDFNGNPMNKYGGTYNAPANAGGAGWMQPTFDIVDAFQTDAVTGLPLLDTYHTTPIAHDNGITSNQPFTPHAGTLDPRLDWSVGRRGIPYRDWGVHPGSAWVRNQQNGGPYVAIKNTAEQARMDTDQGRFGATNNPINLIRFADVLLWAAECEIEIGSLQAAENYVNQVRARAANPDGFVKTYIDPANPLAGFTNTPAANYYVGLYNGQFEANGKSYARKALFFERRLEFALEQHRFLDMVRYAQIEPSLDLANYFNTFMAREGARITNASNAYKIGQFVNGKNEVLPIPQVQIDLSQSNGEPVLTQNPGYF